MSAHSRPRSFDKSALAPILNALRWVFAVDRAAALRQAAGQLLTAMSSLALILISAVLFKRLLGSAGFGTFAVVGPVIAFAVLTGITGAVSGVSTQRQRLLAEKVESSLWRQIMTVTGSVPLVTYESTGFITKLAAVQQNALTRPLQTVRSVFAMVGAVLTAVALGIGLGLFSVWLPLILLLTAVPSVSIAKLASRSEFGFSKTVVPMYLRRGYLRRIVTERAHAAELRAFDAIPILRARHDSISTDMERQLAKQAQRRTRLVLGTSAAATTGLLVALLVLVLLVDDGRITLAQAGAAAIAARLFGSALSSAYSAYGNLAESAPHLRDLDEFLRTYGTVTNGVGPLAPASTATTVDVAVRAVEFRYPESERTVLHDVSMTIAPGEVVALVGENGSGKTTLARIVAGLFDPSAGDVTLDGAAASAADRRRVTSFLAQDFGRYSFTVTQNIALGGPWDDSVGEGVRAASHAAQFDDVVAGLPDGYDTVLARELDEGVDLSGGQWQRLALARAMLRARPLLILDEPSAALDPRSESELFDDVRGLLRGRSALLISHRFASARLADRIYVLHHGHVVESGTHVELMAAGGRYAELFALQSAAFVAGLDGSYR